MEGTRFKHFKVRQLLGRGGMGEVYLAEDTTLERLVALKVLPRDLTGDPAAQARLLDEARSCSRVQHPNIATVYAIEEDGGVHALVMEFVEGRTLREIIAKKSLSLSRVTRIGRAIAEGLIAAHDGGIVHRDLKPANVMLTDRGEVKIMDFGLAFRPKRIVQTVGDKAYGTVNYMAPEQARGEIPTAATDIFSYGVLLYELLTGRCPFEADNDLAVLHMIVSGEPRPLRELRRDVPPALEALVRRCMEKEPPRRFTSMREVAEELQYAEPNVEHGPRDLISELGRGLAPKRSAEPPQGAHTPRRRGAEELNDGLPQMAPDLRVPISDILLALDEQPNPPSRSRGPVSEIPEGFVLAQNLRERPALDPRIGAGVVLETVSATYHRVDTERREAASSAKQAIEPPPRRAKARPAEAPRAASPTASSSQAVFIGPEPEVDSYVPSPTRIAVPPRVHRWKNALGLLIALLIAGFGFLGLLRAAGVQDLPGGALLDRIPALFSNASNSAPSSMLESTNSRPTVNAARRLGATADSSASTLSDSTRVR